MFISLASASAFTSSVSTHAESSIGITIFFNQNQWNSITPTRLSLSNQNEMEDLRNEIELMKEEALAKLNLLDEKISIQIEDCSEDKFQETTLNRVSSVPKDLVTESESDYYDEAIEKRYKLDKDQRIAVSNDPTIVVSPKSKSRTRAENLLDGTRWKASLNIGRDPGTWMPKDWGVSGERLKLDFDFELSDEQLYEREEFLGSMGDAKILKVKNNEIILSPSLTEGEKNYVLSNGGWRIVRGIGPLGTDLFRFYVEIAEQIRRKKGDVYVPAGRIYCSCGFFDLRRVGPGEKSRFRQKLDDMMIKAESLDEEIASAGNFSVEKIKKRLELIRLKVDMQQTAERLASASVTEPDSSILRTNPSGDAAVTKEGGVVCKVVKGGVAIEYHILGKFYIQNSS